MGTRSSSAGPPVERRSAGRLRGSFGHSSAVWIVAIAFISAMVAMYSFAQASHGFDRFIAYTTARKTARQFVVETLDEEAALRRYTASGAPQALREYRFARTSEEPLEKMLRSYVAGLPTPATEAAFVEFEQTKATFDAEAGASLAGRTRQPVPNDVFAKIRSCRRDLMRLVEIFNDSGMDAVVGTKRRILLGGIVSVASTLLLGAAALLMETLRRRLARRRAAELEANIVEREKAEASALRADALDAGRLLLEREITERKRVEKRLAFTAFHDELTGLPNRALFMDRWSEMVAQVAPGVEHFSAILFLDRDRFKMVNDSLGHAVGDQLLQAVARRLQLCLRTGDTLARLGGDEFAMLVDGVEDAAAACRIAEHALGTLEKPFKIAGHDVFASASVGIAVSRTGYDRPEDLLRNADIAMYRAKERGKRRYELFEPELLTRAVRLLEVQTDLRRALDRKEFRLFYQPIVSLPDRRIRGFEALLRWQHPLRGMLAPDEFISVAEETGAIVAIGEWVLATACRQLRSWRDTYAFAQDLDMNVNVSTKQLSPEFPRVVERALAKSGLPRDRLNIEITESAIMESPDVARPTLHALRNLGVGLHLDDFGTGYSSLAYLHDFPIDTLKVDRSFINRSGNDVANPQIVATIVALARSLSMEVTIEGIETSQQLAALQKMGCTRAQGYFFSRPVDGAAAGALLSAQYLRAPQSSHAPAAAAVSSRSTATTLERASIHKAQHHRASANSAAPKSADPVTSHVT